MTLLTICQNAADEIGLPQPASIIGNQEPDVQKMLRLSNKGGKYLTVLPNFYWRVLTKDRTFTGISGQEQTGILPSDFLRMVPETFWNRSVSRLVTNVTEVQWTGLEATNYVGPEFKFLYRGNSIYITPSVLGAELAFSYVTPNWCQSSGGTPQSSWAADTDTGILNEELLTYDLVFRYKYADGLPSNEDKLEYADMLQSFLDNDQPAAGTMLSADIFGGGRAFSGAPRADGPWNMLGYW